MIFGTIPLTFSKYTGAWASVPLPVPTDVMAVFINTEKPNNKIFDKYGRFITKQIFPMAIINFIGLARNLTMECILSTEIYI